MTPDPRDERVMLPDHLPARYEFRDGEFYEIRIQSHFQKWENAEYEGQVWVWKNRAEHDALDAVLIIVKREVPELCA